MNIIRSDKAIFCDVDDTLIIWDESERGWHPHQKHLRLLRQFHKRGQPIILWSAGGYQWAEKAAILLGIRNIVTLCLGKPAWYVDDKTSVEFMPETNRIFLKE